MVGNQVAGTLAHRVGDEQLAAGRRPQRARTTQSADLVGVLLSAVERPLVGHRELPDVLDVVAEELDADRMRIGRREDVEQPAADRELAPALDEVDARIREIDEPAHGLVQIGAVTDPQPQRCDLAQTPDHRLQHAAHRADHDAKPRAAVEIVLLGMREAAQYGEPAPDGVRPWGEPLVRKGFPAREEFDAGRVEQAAQRIQQVVRLAAGRDNGEQRCGGRPRRQRERPDAGDRDDVVGGGLADGGERRAQRRVGEDEVDERRERPDAAVTAGFTVIG